MNPMIQLVDVPEAEGMVGTGWLPPLPDLRDYTEEHQNILSMSSKLGLKSKVTPTGIPPKVDLRKWCSPIENQGSLGSCTAHSASSIIEYFENRAFGRYINVSRLFVYKTTRNLMGVTGDTGAWLRNVMGALVLCGWAPERYWIYTDNKPDFDNEPSAFVYSIADNYEALRYFCHDPLGSNIQPSKVLQTVKIWLWLGVPSMFGFFGFSSFSRSNVKGGIPYPCPGERARWGHAIAAVGYDDSMKIKNMACGKVTTGALLIRNSWGTGWGDNGYGWLPYDYVLNRLAVDFWSILGMDWVNTKKFGI